MHHFITAKKNALGAAIGTAVVGSAAVNTSAHAEAYQMDTLTTGITDQVTESLTVALPVGGGLLALFVGFRIVKRLIK